MDLREELNKLKEFYLYINDGLEENFVPDIVLMNAYHDYELQYLFANGAKQARMLEPFLLRCYVARFQLNFLNENSYLIEKNINSEAKEVVFEMEKYYLNILVNISNIFDELKISSISREYFELVEDINRNFSSFKNEIKCCDFNSEKSYVNGLYEDHKMKLLGCDNAIDEVVTKMFAFKSVKVFNELDLNSFNELICDLVQREFEEKNSSNLANIMSCLKYISSFNTLKRENLNIFLNNIYKDNSELNSISEQLGQIIEEEPIECYSYTIKL